MENHAGMTIYTCPMHPEVQQPSPGICPKCGMNLVPVTGAKEYSKHEGHTVEVFLRKAVICFALTVPVVLYSDILEKLFGWTAPAFPGSAYMPLIFSTLVFFYGGLVFVTGAIREIRARLPGMMTLIAIAITSAYVYSVAAVLILNRETLFWEITTLITVMLFGHWLEMKAVRGTQQALKELAKLLPDTAEVIRNGKSTIVPLGELRVGDIVLVRPGGKIPADGIVTEGRSDVNESMVTGESKPVSKKVGTEVIAGTSNGDGRLEVKVSRIGEKTFLAGVMRLVAEAQASKSRLQILSDKAAFYLTIIAIVSGSATFVAWLAFKGDFPFALERMVTVLIIACPHALGLAVPLVASISTTLAAKGGLLVKQRLALEAARNIDVVLFDKTGTLTKGEYGVTEVIANPEMKVAEDAILQYAASVDKPSEHFVARAIVTAAEKKGLKIVDVKNFTRVPGKGVRGTIERKEVLAGGESILSEAKIAVPTQLKTRVDELARQGKTIIYVIIAGKLTGFIALADLIREESRDAITALKALGVKIAMITGDSEDVAKWVSTELGVDEYFARVLPDQKAEKVRILQDRKLRVAMVGDGINDAPALTQADVGIAIGAGTNVAIESAGIILVRSDPRDIVKIVSLSRQSYKKMIQNLFWATGYNVVAIPLAAGVLASKGILLQPAVGAIFMSVSTIIVALNAMLLKRAKLI